jgi:hypothetical protein
MYPVKIPFVPRYLQMKRAVCLLKALLLTFLAGIGSVQGQVIISEFMASNTRTLLDEDGESSDWIEIFNLGQTNVNLNGWGLTDTASDPRRWRFPLVELPAGKSLLVFASGKNRRVPGSPLHTDFRLSGTTGYLGLADPNGTNVFSYTAYAEQAPDISFGVVWDETRTTILKTNAPVRVMTPADEMLGTGWTALEYPVGNWPLVPGPVGFDQNPTVTDNAWLIAMTNSAPAIWYQFEGSGTLVANSGALGSSLNGTNVGGITTAQLGLRPPEAPGMATNNLAVRFDGSNDYLNTGKGALNDLAAFTMAGWIKPTALTKARVGLWGQHEVIEFGFIEADTLQVSTANGGSVQVEYPGPANLWRFVAVTGNGDVLRIFIDGVQVAEGGNETGNYGASGYPFVIGGGGIFDGSQNWFTGNIDEFTFYPRALAADELFNLYKSAMTPGATYVSFFDTNIAAGMKDANSSVYLRYDAVTTNDFEGLVLNVQADDGFVAYLNGVELARHNAPVEPLWNSAATAERAGRSGLRTLQIDVSQLAGVLHQGANLLAIHGLNSSVNDTDFLMRPELIGVGRRVNTNLVRYFVQPTPGRINGLGDTNAGPLIVSPNHTPKIPQPSEPITVTARLVRTFNDPLDVSLIYRVMYGAETTVTMKDDGLNGDGAAGDGVFGVKIPGSIATQGQMIRWFFRARDTAGNTSRWPLYRETSNSPQYLGTIVNDPRLTNPLPVLHWFIQNASLADGTGGTRASVFWNGVLYDNIFVNLHGQSSQGFPKKSYNFDFNTGFHFQWKDREIPVEDINLLTTFPDKAHVRNILAYEVFRDAGYPYHYVVPVRVQRNATFFSDAHMVEDGDADYLARVGLNPSGALYKMYNSLDSATSGAEKKTRKFENNTDLQQLITGLQSASKNTFVFDNVNIPAMANYLAAMTITANVDCCHKNYYIYRDSEGTREWQFLPWDVDLSFGRVWTTAQGYYDDTMYYDNGMYVGSGNLLPSALFAIPSFNQMYLRRLRTLMDEKIQAPGTPAEQLVIENRVRELYAQIGPDAALDYAKWGTWGTPQTMPQALALLTNTYLPKRRNYLYVTQRSVIPAAITNDVVVNFARFDPNPSTGTQVHEYLSLTNTNRIAIDLTGWKLEGGVEHTFIPGTVIPSNGALYLSPDVNGFRQRPVAPKAGAGLFIQGNYKGQLSARGETVVLKDKNGRTVSTFTYPGAPTIAQNQLRLIEILFAPPINSAGIPREELEYVVLKNIGATALNLKGVHFTNGVTFTIYSDFVLEPSNSVYVAKNPDAFRTVYGNQLPVTGPYIGQFSNQGEAVELYDAVGESVLDFSYDEKWYPLTETRGHSLMVADDHKDYAAWGAKETWTFSAFPGGSAAAAQAWANFQKTFFTAAELAEGAITTQTADADGDGLTNYEEFVAGSSPRQATSTTMMSVLSVVGASLQVQFPVVTGRYYSVWSTTDAVNGTWTREPNGFRATGSGAYTMRLDDSADATKFYRLQIEL